MKKLSAAFPQGHISLQMLGQTMYYAKSPSGFRRNIARHFATLFRRKRQG